MRASLPSQCQFLVQRTDAMYLGISECIYRAIYRCLKSGLTTISAQENAECGVFRQCLPLFVYNAGKQAGRETSSKLSSSLPW